MKRSEIRDDRGMVSRIPLRFIQATLLLGSSELDFSDIAQIYNLLCPP